jgi:polysaccharide pyruvyl transferase WcaK-like protein
MNRRQFLIDAGSLSAMAAFLPLLSCTGKKQPQILVVSGWQDVNIGDIAHTPGLLHILETAFPEANIVLWKVSRNDEVETLLKTNFPKIKIIYGQPDKVQYDGNEDLKQAFETSDVFIHGSGPSVVAASYLRFWDETTGKPFGLYGVTIENISGQLTELLKKAAFIFTRETASIDKLKQAGIEGDNIMFAPDATFDLTIKDDAKALAFMRENGLEEDRFICVIPRLRKTPYWEIRKTHSYSKEEIDKLTELNNRWKEDDHSKARLAIETWVKTTGMKVVLCPEMTYEMGLFDELLYNPLPEDVKPFIVKHVNYWMPDEAMSLYARMHTMLSFECHSPIMALRCGRPAFYLRQPQDTIKGQMYYDLGLSDWVFEIEESTGQQISDRLIEVYNDYDKAKNKIAVAMQQVSARYVRANGIVNKILRGG